MGYQSLTAEDGVSISAYRTDPIGRSRGGVVVLQELFGVNHHIRSICTRLSAAGYVALAPALFDRIEPGFDVGYSTEEIARARTYISRIDWSGVRRDVQAATLELQKEGPVAVVGFCFGGTVAYASAIKIPGLFAAVAFYGQQIIKYADQAPKCPTQMHFGEMDTHIPMADVATLRLKRPDAEIHTYPALHGFNCDERESFHGESAAIAWGRTLEFLSLHTPRS